METFSPFVGPHSVPPDRNLYGRDHEVQELYDLIIAERIVLFYGPSGAGKTSLIQAGLRKRLEKSFQVFPTIRLSEDPAELDALPTANRYVWSMLRSLEVESPKPISDRDLAGIPIETYLSQRQWIRKDVRPKLLVFDQFEEALTLDPTDLNAKNEFFAQLGLALRNRARWALIVIKEESLAQLDPFLRYLPTRLNNRYRLEPLTAKGAIQAIRRPPAERDKQRAVEIDQEAAELLVNDLRKTNAALLNPAPAPGPLPYVEPLFLQVVCERLCDRALKEGIIKEEEGFFKGRLDKDYVAKTVSVKEALASFYNDKLAEATQGDAYLERAVREWIDDNLIGPHGIRKQKMTLFDDGEIINATHTDALTKVRILSRWQRGARSWVEISHDRLVEPIITENHRWFERNDNELEYACRKWKENDCRDDFLITGKRLYEIEAIAKKSKSTPSSIAFLEKCRKLDTGQRTIALFKKLTRFSLFAFASIISILSISYYIYHAKTKKSVRELKLEQVSLSSKITHLEYYYDNKLKETNAAQMKLIRQSEVKSLAVYSEQMLARQDTELAALLARQAYMLYAEDQKPELKAIVGNSLRNVLQAKPFHTTTLKIQSQKFAISPNSEYYAVRQKGALQVFGGDRLHAPYGKLKINEPALALAFHPSRPLIAMVMTDSIAFWDFQQDKLDKIVIEGLNGAFVFNGDGAQWAAADRSGYVYTGFTQAEAQTKKLFEFNQGTVTSLAFDRSSQLLAVILKEGLIGYWDFESGAFFQTALDKTNREVQRKNLYGFSASPIAVGFSPNSQWLAVAKESGEVFIVNRANLEEQAYLRYSFLSEFKLDNEIARGRLVAKKIPEQRVHARFSPDQGQLLFGGDRGALEVWSLSDLWQSNELDALDLSAGTLVKGPQVDYERLNGFPGRIQGLGFAKTGAGNLALASDGSELGFWTLQGYARHTRAELKQFAVISGEKQSSYLRDVAFHPNGAMLASSSSRAGLQLWNTPKSFPAGPRSARRFDLDFVVDLDFWGEGPYIAAATAENGLYLLDPLENKTLRSIESVNGKSIGRLHAVASSAKENVLAAGGENAVYVWPQDNLFHKRRSPVVLPQIDAVKDIAFNPKNGELAVGLNNGHVRIYREFAKERSRSFDIIHNDKDKPVLDPIRDLEFTADGSRLLIADSNKVSVWDAESWEAEEEAIEEKSRITKIASSHDGKLALSLENGEVLVYDLQSISSPPIVLKGHESEALSVAFHPTGNMLASCDTNSTIILWNLDMEQMASLICEIVPRDLSPFQWKRFLGSSPQRPLCEFFVQTGAIH